MAINRFISFHRNIVIVCNLSWIWIGGSEQMMCWVNIPSLTPITAPESKSSLLAYLHTCFWYLLLTFCHQKLAAFFHVLENTAARDCAVIVTTQGLVWSPAAWKNKHELTYLSLAVTCIVVLGCEMHLCGDCRSKDITHFFWISRQCLVCFTYWYACYCECDWNKLILTF